MGFWKNDVPDIISLKKDEQGFITIEHSQGVFKMHENEVRDLSLVKDARSKPHNEDFVWILNGILALLFCSGMQNIISQISYLYIGVDPQPFEFFGGAIFGFINNLTLKVWIWLAFVTAHLLMWFYVFNKLKHLYYCMLNQKNDILLIRNTSASFSFRFRNNIEIQEISQHVLEDKNSKLSRVVWGSFLVALWICCGLVFLKKIPFWFENGFFSFFIDMQDFDAYIAYRKSEIDFLKLFTDGMISIIVLTTLLIGSLLYVLFWILFLYSPLYISLWILSKFIVSIKSPIDGLLSPFGFGGEVLGPNITFLLPFIIFFPILFLISAFFPGISFLFTFLCYIPFGIIMSSGVFLVVHFIRRRKDKNHVE